MNAPKIDTLVAEDEPVAAEALAAWVEETPRLRLAGVCHDGATALQRIRELRPGLVLTDIQMPGLTGLEVLKALREDDHCPRVIFTTAYDEHAITAFELHAVDYLLKPFSRERFDEAVEHALQMAEASSPPVEALQPAEAAEAAEPLSRLLVRDQGRIFPISVLDIESLQSDHKYTAILSGGRSFLVRLPIASFEARLDPRRFVKLHRGCIVNMDFVESMAPTESSQLEVRLRSGTRVVASREVSKKLREMSL